MIKTYWYGFWGGLIIADKVEIILNFQSFLFGFEFCEYLISMNLGPVEFQWWFSRRAK